MANLCRIHEVNYSNGSLWKRGGGKKEGAKKAFFYMAGRGGKKKRKGIVSRGKRERKTALGRFALAASAEKERFGQKEEEK